LEVLVGCELANTPKRKRWHALPTLPLAVLPQGRLESQSLAARQALV